jgi:hypothetical protein
MPDKVRFHSEQECIDNYLTEYIKQSQEELETYYTMYNGKKLFCIRIEGTKGMNTFKTYEVSKKWQMRNSI